MTQDLDQIAGNIHTAIQEQLRLLDPFLKQGNDSLGIHLDVLNKTKEDLSRKTIETRVNGVTKYKTHFSLTEDIVSEYPSEQPAQEDMWWKDHQKKCETYIENRKELIEHAMDLIPETLGKIFSPFGEGTAGGIVGLIKWAAVELPKEKKDLEEKEKKKQEDTPS